MIKTLAEIADDELEEQVLCAMAEAIAKGRRFHEVCLKIIEIVDDLIEAEAGEDTPINLPRRRH